MVAADDKQARVRRRVGGHVRAQFRVVGQKRAARQLQLKALGVGQPQLLAEHLFDLRVAGGRAAVRILIGRWNMVGRTCAPVACKRHASWADHGGANSASSGSSRRSATRGARVSSKPSSDAVHAAGGSSATPDAGAVRAACSPKLIERF